jgi:Ni/Co efflux regulator RcnB
MLASPAAFAQDEHHHHGGSQGSHESGSHGGGDHRGPSGATSRPAATPSRPAMSSPRTPSTSGSWAAQHGAKVKVQTTASPGAVYNNAVRNDRDRRDNNRRDYDRRDNNRHDNNWRGNDRRGDRHDNNWRGNDNHRGNWAGRFDRRNVSARHHYRYRGRSWYWPNGYRYQRWTFGMTLPSIFWASDYWISDYYDYGLGAPPPGTVWVRYGNDAILIDRYSGEILEVVYDQFY